MKNFIILFISGGLGYNLLEIVWRGHTHWTMFLLGGLCFYLLYATFSLFPDMPLLLKAIIGGGIITVAEFITGCIVNIIFKLNVWSYSQVPFNLLGQVCLAYYFLWTALCIPIALLFKLVGKYIR